MEALKTLGSMIVEWSEEVFQSVAEIMAYLEENASLRTAQQFYTLLWEAHLRIKNHPTTGRPSAKIDGVRSMKVGKHKKLFYWYDEGKQKVILLSLFDMRQHPEKSNY
ncbi:MAG: type II toxin-antitoxin system RelE/ParE family toxin [Saprospiraceae bacterium]